MGVLHYIRHRSKQRMLNGERLAWIENSERRDYIRAAVMSAPPWVKFGDFDARIVERNRLEKLHGEPYQRDHIIPLGRQASKDRVCGLTVPWNLRPIPARTNNKKSNAWCQWHGELFDKPEQLRLAL